MLDDREALSNFIDNMKAAQENARAMGYTTQNGVWFKVAENIDAIRSLATQMAAKAQGRRLIMPWQ